MHVCAVLFARSALELDTNFFFAAAGLHVAPYQVFFAPYYFLAVLALFMHLGCAAYWYASTRSRRVRSLALAVPIVTGAAVSVVICLSLAGRLVPVDIPAEFTATYEPNNLR